MTADELVTTVRRAGGDLIREGSAIRYRGPRAFLTPDLRAAIKAHKLALVALLPGPELVSAGTTPIGPAETIFGRPDAPAREPDPRTGLCVFCPWRLAPCDPLACEEHRRHLGEPSMGNWRCVCLSAHRRLRPEWGDYVCAACGMIGPSPEERP